MAVDLGGTRLRLAVVDVAGRVLAVERLVTPQAGAEAVVARIVATGTSLVSRHQGVAVVGVAAPGPLDPQRGMVFDTPNLDGFKDFPLGDRLADGLGLPVWLQNDANLAALGEHRFGAGRGADPLIYLTVSTGVGGGIVRGGHIDGGHGGLAGELGHIVVADGGPACNFGHRGCLEGLASGTALARRAVQRLAQGAASSLAATPPEDITAAGIARAAADGDPVAADIFATMGRFLGLAVGSLINALDPERVVIGGGLAAAWHLFAPAMGTGIAEIVMVQDRRRISVVPAATGDDAGLLGAATYALEEVGVPVPPSAPDPGPRHSDTTASTAA